MKTYMPLNGFRWSRNSGFSLNNMSQTDVLGRAGEYSSWGYIKNVPPWCAVLVGRVADYYRCNNTTTF